MENRINKLEGEVKNTRTQMFNQKKIAREDTQRASLQVDSMKSQMDNAMKRERESFNKMMMLEKDLEETRDSYRGLKRENEKVKADFQQTLKMCEAYESKIANYSRRDENVRNIIDQNK